jgi:hypothetical protein
MSKLPSRRRLKHEKGSDDEARADCQEILNDYDTEAEIVVELPAGR